MAVENDTQEYYEPDYKGRPLVFVKDHNGDGWLCEKGVDPDGDLQAQGCWQCEEIAFPFGGR